MKLSILIQTIKTHHIIGNSDTDVLAITFDSRKVQPGSLFFALKGEVYDGHDYIVDVVKNGAAAVVCELLPEKLAANICYVQVPDSHEVMGIMASEFYGNPSSKLKLVGVTGTNGKTTTVTLLYNMFRKLGYKAGLLSTVVNYVDMRTVEATHTTPDAIILNKLLAEMLDAGCDYCFMEISSHAVVQKRISGLKFAGAVFSNITHDHLDYHKTFIEYIRAKKAFFDNLPAGAFALINTDDKNGRIMVQNTKATIKTYGLRSMADFKCRILEHSFEAMLLSIDGIEVWVRFIGEFNAYNLLAVYATVIQLLPDSNALEMLQILSTLTPVSGRFELIAVPLRPKAIVDYAHTPDALQNVLDTINNVRKHQTVKGKLITVVGCGGNRDKAKRPVMARIAAENSDRVILTSDNPRFEDPHAILEDMKAGLDNGQIAKTLIISDRVEAIKTAVFLSSPDDIILIAGKGHEDYQEIQGVKYHFDDEEVISAVINS
ncbi:MAG: UDP-N-acetylmuramoyl-L-alanyl-D-glutamate--2,6-diaminopimelate ligase [Prevotellaceae bacterium]|jgi:UDP-N-acetylmuramoyl-L-alanyl-D-glutamate--2,6-diaminopimelate ligase|nr:UDP-N-acetylmuramoyl-L-alanyl-D-glutamate--2,6-diaminopimelate ligase [Prevotellaceae bacterium]